MSWLAAEKRRFPHHHHSLRTLVEAGVVVVFCQLDTVRMLWSTELFSSSRLLSLLLFLAAISSLGTGFPQQHILPYAPQYPHFQPKVVSVTQMPATHPPPPLVQRQPPPTQQHITFQDIPDPGEVETQASVSLQALRPVIERGLLELCLSLEKASNGLSSTENTVLAPLSVAAIAALLLAGSKNQTRKELEKVFGVENIPHRGEELHRTLGALFTELESGEAIGSILYGSGLFVQAGEALNPDYLRLAKQVYRSEVQQVDYRKAAYNASLLINKWVSEKTEGKIRTLLKDAVPPSTSIIIANVFYFRGAWEQPFAQRFTKMEKFYVSRTETMQVQMMAGQMNVPYSKVRGSHALVGLPYSDPTTKMYYLLPEVGLRKFIAAMTPESLRHYINQTKVQQTIVAVPRMRVEGSLELSRPLSTIGVSSVFKPGVADLSGIGEGHNYHVSEMLHKVSLEVTETGTVGAAATAVTILRDGSTPLFRADRPFLFFVFHEPTGSIIFWGTVFRPQPIGDSQSSQPAIRKVYKNGKQSTMTKT